MSAPVLSDWAVTYGVAADLVICALGYESRASTASRKYSWNAQEKYTLAYRDQETLSFAANESYFKEQGYSVIKSTNSEFAKDFADLLSKCTKSDGPLQVILDISCFSRYRLAIVFEQFLEYAEHNKVTLHVAYTISDYVAPPEGGSTNSRVGPVTAAFAGWSCDPDLPPAAIVGLGYERRKALGAVEYLQSANVWLFAPQSPVKEFFNDVVEVNAGLIDSIPEDRILEYKLDQPALTYSVLNSLVSGLCTQFNPVIMPFGPKIFFLLSLIVSVHYPSVSIWSVDGEESEPPVDRAGSGHTIAFSIQL